MEKLRGVRPSQSPVPSPWNQNGKIRFKRRTGSNRAETKVELMSRENIDNGIGRHALTHGRQYSIIR